MVGLSAVSSPAPSDCWLDCFPAISAASGRRLHAHLRYQLSFPPSCSPSHQCVCGLDKLICAGRLGQYGRIVPARCYPSRDELYLRRAQRASGNGASCSAILPNVWSPVIVIASFTGRQQHSSRGVAQLPRGRGAPSVPSWGTMLADGRQYMDQTGSSPAWRC